MYPLMSWATNGARVCPQKVSPSRTYGPFLYPYEMTSAPAQRVIADIESRQNHTTSLIYLFGMPNTMNMYIGKFR